MEDEENKFILMNYRPLFCMFIGMIFGELLIFLIFLHNKQFLFIYLFTIISILGLISALIFKFLKTSPLKTVSKFIFTISIGIVLALSFTTIKFNKISEYPITNGNYQISGKICEVSKYDTSYVLILDNINISGNNYDFKVKVNLQTSYLQDNIIDVGYQITYIGVLSEIKLFDNSKLNNDVTDNIKYSSILKEILQISYGDKDFSIKIKENISNKLNANMPKEYANLSYSLLFGDKSELDSDLYSIFQKCGVAHILAVSGLHISLIVSILIFILKKLKCNKILNLVIVSLFLFIFALLCGFTASVCRASIMSITYLLVDIFGHRKDMLSTFSLAGIIILLVSPFECFTIGFQLSFSCVIGIILLAKPLEKLFNFIKLPNFIKSCLIITISSSIATLPIVANVFNVFYPISIISNLIVLPLFTITFSFLFVFTLLNLIFPFGFLYFIVTHFYNIIITICGLFSLVGGIKLKQFSLFAEIMYFICLLTISQFINLNRNTKIAVCSCIIIIISLTFVVSSSNKKYNDNLLFCNSVSNFNIITTENNSIYILNCGSNGNDYEYYNIKNTLNYRNICKIDGIIITAFDTKSQNNLISLINDFKVNKIIFDEDIEDDLILYYKMNTNLNIEIENFENEYQLDLNVKLSTISCNNIKFATKIDVNNKTNIIINKDLTNNRINTINSIDYDKLIANEIYSHKLNNVFKNTVNNNNYVVKIGI